MGIYVHTKKENVGKNIESMIMYMRINTLARTAKQQKHDQEYAHKNKTQDAKIVKT